MRKVFFSIIMIGFLFSGNAFPFDNEETHRRLTNEAVEKSKFAVDKHLETNLNLPGGIETYLKGITIKDWLKKGSFLEDEPNCRASNHFHNPLKDWTESYMSDQTWYINWWCSSGEYPPQNINSAVHWATGYTAPAPAGLNKPTGNQWDWDHAREHYIFMIEGETS
ncbi:MAG TPA: hypothetical protein PK874_01900 [Desulfobacteraceae bacterium]|nr:hypothetical protein [Desulfobacteraceae bacterium]HPJ68269.1 hypothetical protein [Desulfobacteraceae bacterium]HPQ27938.1 hypothetical protein [Desulfobacteraceae bacterium]